MVYRLCANECESRLADPPPKLNVLLMAVCLEALFCLEVEELQRSALRPERNDGLSQVHDGAVCANWSSDNIVRVLEIDDDSLGRSIGFVVSLTHANVLVRLERLASCQYI